MTRGRRAVRWVLLASLPTFLLTAVLLLLGEEGAWIATILAVPIGVYAFLIPSVLSLASEGPPKPPMPLRRKLLVGALVVVLGGILPGGIWWGLETYGDLDVDLGGTFVLEEGAPVTVPARIEKKDWGGNLVFIPRLANTQQVNSCVRLRDSLHITPVADGRLLPVAVTEDGKRVSAPIEPGTREVQLIVLFVDPSKQGCVVNATLSGGRLER